MPPRRPTVVVALVKKPRIPSRATANKATTCVGALCPCDHRRHYEKEGDPEGSPSSLLLAQPSSAGASGSSVLVERSRNRNW
jgi:hypothetical protein